MSIEALDIRTLFKQPGAPAYPFYDDRGQLCWLEALTDEGGRLAIRQQLSGSDARVVTPRDFQIRSRVHEYGGQCFCIAGDMLYFNNYADGLIYRQNLHDDSAPQCVSISSPGVIGHADLHYSRDLHALVAIQEASGLPVGAPNTNRIVAINLAQTMPADMNVLAEGADFYAAPCLSGSGDQLAWIEWFNPYMPWDESRLMSATVNSLESGLSLGAIERLAGGRDISICQPGFLSDGSLVFAMDSVAPISQPENYWNLYRYQGGETTALTHLRAEFGEAHWVFGQNRWVQINDHTLLAVRTRDESDVLCEIDIDSGKLSECSEAVSRFSQLSCCDKGVLAIAHYTDRPASIIRYQSGEGLTAVKPSPDWMVRENVSEPELLCFPTRDGAYAYANYYAAKPLSATQPISLLVLVHGGPTARADTALSPLVQYFCQNGFAVLDVNHRGSTGHGRHYRQKLLGQWGEIDAGDIADAIDFAFKQKQHDPQRVFIRGGSAGGYAVLRALTRFPELFSGGACYYGIGNLITLAEITHKFEGRYTDRLIGESYDPDHVQLANSRFRSRSPIFDIKHIRSPLILFQGLDDKVVPPEVSQEMVATLAANGVKHEYIEYPGEGHGFRKANTRIDALQREIDFYRTVLASQ